LTPFGQRGNYFENLDRHGQRDEWLANLLAPSFQAAGAHQIRFGVNLERNGFHQDVRRHDYAVLRNDLSPVRYVTFAGSPFQRQMSMEASQYLQDRWTPREGLLIEAGVRADWNEIVRDVVWSPRLSFAWAPRWLRDTKVASGLRAIRALRRGPTPWWITAWRAQSLRRRRRGHIRGMRRTASSPGAGRLCPNGSCRVNSDF